MEKEKICFNCINVLESNTRLGGHILYCNLYSNDIKNKVLVPNVINGIEYNGIEVFNEAKECEMFKEKELK